jgi:hypothetical protein
MYIGRFEKRISSSASCFENMVAVVRTSAASLAHDDITFDVVLDLVDYLEREQRPSILILVL